MARIKVKGRDRVETMMLMLADIRRDVKELKRARRSGGRKRIDYQTAVNMLVDFVAGRKAMNGNWPYLQDMIVYMESQGYSTAAINRARRASGCTVFKTSLSVKPRIRLPSHDKPTSVNLGEMEED